MVYTVRGAWRDLNSKGKGPEAFRKVWRDGRWQWVSGYLPRGILRASDRRASTRGDVETGEIVAEFSRDLPERRCTLDGFWVVVDQEEPLQAVEHTKPQLGVYRLEVDGQAYDLPDPLAHD